MMKRILSYGTSVPSPSWFRAACFAGAGCAATTLITLYEVFVVFGPGHGSPSLAMRLFLPYAVLGICCFPSLDGSTLFCALSAVLQYAAYAGIAAYGAVRHHLARGFIAVGVAHAIAVTISEVVVKWFWY